jgi:hypothetical protein
MPAKYGEKIKSPCNFGENENRIDLENGENYN